MSTPAVEHVTHGEATLAIIIRQRFDEPGLHFFTPAGFSQQLAYMSHPRGKIIEAHVHNPVERAITCTQEVLIVRRGAIRVDFYSSDKLYVTSRVLEAGDVALLAEAGHGFEVLEDIQMIEVKQGPYIGDRDKTRFPAVSSSSIVIG